MCLLFHTQVLVRILLNMLPLNMRFIHMESTRRAQMERLVSTVLAVWSGQWGRINHGERTVGSSQIAEPESIVRVKNLHGRLNQVVGTLSEKISAVLQKQVRTLVFVFCLLFGWFKSTGEGILSSLQSSYVQCTKRNLQELRAKVDEAELAMKKVKFIFLTP